MSLQGAPILGTTKELEQSAAAQFVVYNICLSCFAARFPHVRRQVKSKSGARPQPSHTPSYYAPPLWLTPCHAIPTVSWHTPPLYRCLLLNPCITPPLRIVTYSLVAHEFAPHPPYPPPVSWPAPRPLHTPPLRHRGLAPLLYRGIVAYSLLPRTTPPYVIMAYPPTVSWPAPCPLYHAPPTVSWHTPL